jgi:predicted nucleic-acid-binding Zn-ribbon protein
MRLSQKDLRRFLEGTAKADRACGHCGNRQFTLNVNSTAPDGEPSSLRVYVEEAAGFHEFYSAACTRCGRTDFHHINQIEAWLAANSGTQRAT